MTRKNLREFALLQRPPLTYVGKVVRDGEVLRVRIMARAEGWALVRRNGCVPFAVEERLLSPADAR